jgi:hypothetical protein
VLLGGACRFRAKNSVGFGQLRFTNVSKANDYVKQPYRRVGKSPAFLEGA